MMLYISQAAERLALAGQDAIYAASRYREGCRCAGCVMLVKPMIMVIVSALLGPAMGVGLFLLMQVQ
jgi:hypothetical protein